MKRIQLYMNKVNQSSITVVMMFLDVIS